MFRFISLGGDCQTAAQIAGSKRSTMYHFFDLISIPIDQAIRLIENDFQDMLIPENLHPCYNDEMLGRVIDTEYRMDIGHDFRDFSPADIEAVRKRFALRARWFRDLFRPDRTAPYFVRRWHPRDGEDDERLPMRLFELLRAKRRDIRMLYLHKDPERPPLVSGAYRSHYLAPPETPYWLGNTEAWQYLLHDFAVRDTTDSAVTAQVKTAPRWSHGLENVSVASPEIEAVRQPLKVAPRWSQPAPDPLGRQQPSDEGRRARALPLWQPMQPFATGAAAANDGSDPAVDDEPRFG